MLESAVHLLSPRSRDRVEAAEGELLAALDEDADGRCHNELRLWLELVDGAVLKVQVIRDRTGLERVGNILIDNHYGWFERVKIGHYQISPRGRREIVKWLGLGDKAVEIGG